MQEDSVFKNCEDTPENPSLIEPSAVAESDSVKEISDAVSEIVPEEPVADNEEEPTDSIEKASNESCEKSDEVIEDEIPEALQIEAHDDQKTKKVKSLSNDEVTDHTASLWKYQPIPEDEPEKAEEYINNVYSFKNSKVVAARVRGKKHKHDGTNCDDWYETASCGDIVIAAVSDGAGSKRFSRIGAKVACKTSVGYLISSINQLIAQNPATREELSLELSSDKCMQACGKIAQIVQQSVIKAYEATELAFYSRSIDERYSKVLNRDLQHKDFSSTLLIAVVIPINNETKENLVITCQIGDGMIALVNTNETYHNAVKLMGNPDSGDFSGETDFLTSPKMKNITNLQSRTKISRCISDTIFLMTDGVADDYFPYDKEVQRLYLDLLVNGVCDLKQSGLKIEVSTPERMQLIKKIPEPVIHSWVNNQDVKIAVQYTRRICTALGISLENAWDDITMIKAAALEMIDSEKGEDSSQRLKVWLDNYVERGSFDDRTLVMIQI